MYSSWNSGKASEIFWGGGDKLLIVGASGHGKAIADLARKIGCYKKIYFLDDDIEVQKRSSNVIGNSDFALKNKKEYDVIVAIGNGKTRKCIQEKFVNAKVSVVSLIHPSATLAENVTVGRGTVIMAGVTIQEETQIGIGVIVNTSSSIDHECKIGDYTHVAVGTHLAGNVYIKDNVWVGAGAIISNNVSLCENVVIGAGAVVVRDIKKQGTYVGVPAKRIKWDED